ncbi:MAG: hypothetical protein MI924_35710 [Chloroflexales bacterium]|nr:hypothetical protein [Chloroflexales bacterium]
MAFEVTEHNIAALEPLFKPWEEPIRHRLPNPAAGQPALIHPGRRPSKVPLVRAIRAEVDGWRRGGYAGVSDKSRFLLTYWFDTEHQVADPNLPQLASGADRTFGRIRCLRRWDTRYSLSP